MKEIIQISPTGAVTLPLWVWKRLLKESRLRSKRFRKQKKAVKKKFSELVKRAYYEKVI